MGQNPSAVTGRSFRNWLLELRNSHSLLKSRTGLIDGVLEGYDSARHGTGVSDRSDCSPFGVRLLTSFMGECIENVHPVGISKVLMIPFNSLLFGSHF